MDAGMDILGGFIYFFAVGGIIIPFVPAIILDIIWYIRVKSGKSKKFGSLGIISIFATAWALLGIPYGIIILLGYNFFIR